MFMHKLNKTKYLNFMINNVDVFVIDSNYSDFIAGIIPRIRFTMTKALNTVLLFLFIVE